MAGVDRDQPSRIPRLVVSAASAPLGVNKFSKSSKSYLSRGRFTDKMDGGFRSRTAENKNESNATDVKHFRQQLNKYCKELEELTNAHMQLQNKKESLQKLKTEYKLKYLRDPGEVPEIPTLSDAVLLGEVERLKSENACLIEQYENLKKQKTNSDCARKMENEMPKIENSMAVMLEIINNAETKQNFIEKNLETVKDEIDSILTSLKLITSGQEGVNEFNVIKTELLREKDNLANEVAVKERQIKELRELIDNEHKNKQALEMNLIGLNNDNIRLQEHCRKLKAEVELIKLENQVPFLEKTCEDSSKNSEAIKKLAEREEQILKLQEQNRQTSAESAYLKSQLDNLTKDHDQLMVDFIKIYNECLFDKEHHIYNIKCQMDEIVQLKNITEADGNFKYDLEISMALDDCKSLKSEVLRYHKRWIDSVENEKKLECQLIVNEARVGSLCEELKNCNRTIKNLENLINALKERDKHNCINIKNLQNSLNTKMGDEVYSDENMGQVMQLIEKNMDGRKTANQMLGLVSTLEQYKVTLAGLERKLIDLESVHSLCAERRTRNEQRIALLEIDLAKYE